MPPNDRSDDRRVTLEELLSLKRHEKPDARFWSSFDRELERRIVRSVVNRPGWFERVGGGLVALLSPSLPAVFSAVVIAFGVAGLVSFSDSARRGPVEASGQPSAGLTSREPDSVDAVPAPVSPDDGSLLARAEEKHFVIDVLSSQMSGGAATPRLVADYPQRPAFSNAVYVPDQWTPGSTGRVGGTAIVY